MSSADDHFGHRQSSGIVVDLFWTHGDLGDEFRVEVEDTREGAHFVLYPTTGRAAVQAFHHPFSDPSAGLVPDSSKTAAAGFSIDGASP